jgi:transposase-like protein
LPKPASDTHHIDSRELRLAEGRPVMFLAIDRVSKFTVVAFHDSAGMAAGAAFLRHVVEVFPYAIHTVLTDNSMAFADLPKKAYMHVPASHWTKLHSTNLIKRLNAEIKRRTDAVSIFPNEAAVVRLVGAILLKQSYEWATQRSR